MAEGVDADHAVSAASRAKPRNPATGVLMRLCAGVQTYRKGPMATDITIPPAALEAGARALAAVRMPNYKWEDLDRDMQEYLRGDARAAFLAMIEAWPGMWRLHQTDEDFIPPRNDIILPLPQEGV